MKKLIIIGAILASTALIVALAYEGAFTQDTTKQKKSAVMKIKVNTTDGTFVVEDEDNDQGRFRLESDVVNITGVEEIGKVYKYTNSKCTTYCAGGNCWEFCW